MRNKRKTWPLAIAFLMFAGLGLSSNSAYAQRQADYAENLDVERTIAPYFTEATTKTMTPDPDGFIQRWLLLEPIDKPNQYCLYR